MPNTDTDPKSRPAQSIAEDMATYLEEHPGTCAEGNVHGWRWIRHVNGEWRAAKYGGPHRLSNYVHGEVLDRETVLSWLETKPVQIIPIGEARRWSPKDETVWEDAADQHAFTTHDRCFYCGVSTIDESLTSWQTTEQGVCLFCAGCETAWDEAGELVQRDADTDTTAANS